MTAPWIDSARGVDLVELAKVLRYEVRDRPRGAWISPCPACGAEKRHTKSADKRGAVGVRPDRRGARCFQCDQSFDAINFASFDLGAKRFADLDTVDKATVRALFEGERPTFVPRAVAPSAPSAPEYPPIDDVRALVRRCVPVTQDSDVEAWLQRRHSDPTRVEAHRLALALPSGVEVPDFARIGSSAWNARGFRCVLPLFDSAGVFRSVVARQVEDRCDVPKSLAPRGYSRAGLVFANPNARTLLRGDDMPGPLRVVIREGEPAWLWWASTAARDEALAVFGIFSGAWTRAHADRIPDHATIVISVDDDAAGRRYFDEIAASFDGRDLRLERWNGATA